LSAERVLHVSIHLSIVDGRRAERMAHLAEPADRPTPTERAAIAAAPPALARMVALHDCHGGHHEQREP
jgi:hypothetical protein